MLKARILLKADISDAGAGWSDNEIIRAVDTNASMVYRVRKQLVEEGFAAVPRIFDGEKEAKLIALACSKPPEGRARWTLRENVTCDRGGFIWARACDKWPPLSWPARSPYPADDPDQQARADEASNEVAEPSP